MRARAVLALLVVALAPAGVAAASDTTVQVTDRLEPATVTVPAGHTVTWRNGDDERHRVRSTSGPEKFDSGNLEPLETWSRTFTVPGEYRYVDARNPDVQAYWGTVTVTAQADGGQASSGEPARRGSGAAETGGDTDEAIISMGDRAFAPASVTVPVGASVTWLNDSDRGHTVTADDGSFDSGELAPGARFTQTFEREGSYGYFCAFHSGMQGTVVVGRGPAGDAASDDDPARQPAGSGQPASDEPAGQQPAQPPAIATVGNEVEVEIRDFAFDPDAVVVPAGTTVTWRQIGQAPHTVTAEDGSFDSGRLDAGAVFSHTLTRPGTYRYVCTLHPQMVGEVVVATDGDHAVAAPADDQPPESARGARPREPPGDSGNERGEALATSARGTQIDGVRDTALLAGLLVAAALVAASVLIGTWRIERALRTTAQASRGAPPAARRPRGRT